MIYNVCSAAGINDVAGYNAYSIIRTAIGTGYNEVFAITHKVVADYNRGDQYK